MSKRYSDLLLYESDALAQNTCNHYKSRFLLDHDCTGEIEKDTIPLSQKCHNLFTSFTGKERDAETGFSYYGARYYDPELSALFLSVDPRADKYPGISPYAYCAWNPVKLDLTDMSSWPNRGSGKMVTEKDLENL